MSTEFPRRLALLGIGDIHPGAEAATGFLLRELDKAAPRRVPEVGAGIWLTTERLLRRGWRVTRLALVDMVWTDAAQPEAVPAVAAETERIFGIPGTSIEPLTWVSWRQLLAAAGFDELTAERVGAVQRQRGWRRKILFNGIRQPMTLAHYLSYRKGDDPDFDECETIVNFF